MRRLTDGELFALGVVAFMWMRSRRKSELVEIDQSPDGRVESITVEDSRGNSVTAYPDGPVSSPSQVPT